MNKFILLITAMTMASCAQVNQSVNRIDPRLAELSNNIIGVKNYRYEHVEGEPDQRLILINGSSYTKRYSLSKEAISNACPKGTKADELGRKDDNKSQLKVVVWCKK